MENEGDKLLQSCLLSDKEQRERADQMKMEIFGKARKLIELKDGWDIIFYEPIGFANELIEMVNFERVCCPYFHWGLVFEPKNQATHLQIYGSKTIKEEMRQAFDELNLDIPIVRSI